MEHLFNVQEEIIEGGKNFMNITSRCFGGSPDPHDP
jgi:hypothetical protein